MNLITLIENYDPSLIIEAYNQLESGIQWTDMGHKGRQAGLQYRLNEDPWASNVGKMSGMEFTYNKLNPYFKDTIFEEIINKYQLYRTRLMWVGPYACYSMHQDTTKRLHIPLITNPNCYFVFKQSPPVHLEINNVWEVDTRYSHTFINCSDQPRLHLVGVII